MGIVIFYGIIHSLVVSLELVYVIRACEHWQIS